ncbi:aldo/keto reductase [Halanaerobacter jeridensis]|uniref:Aryl-alcohol dehydrogenase-like predicted oxidoreductase n=1 Tax=Halanaerobacter jeridensis TaxID=706427 RepID=A0A938XWX5_9FIRM|nr:aldo/keto reductase [Halanaerobacter jeridensis]MBM7556800.1 aryl-alcohol dehydrogenase-like predicted oxidoreductase [Halanaerobacter jeridensis]
MQYEKLGNSDLEVSVVGLGTWALGSDFYGEVDDSQSIAAIRQAIDSGINLIDTAPPYGDGHSEEVVGEAIKGYREQVLIATKCGVYRDGAELVRDLSPSTIRKQVNDSLDRLGIDTIDLYQIHWPDTNVPLEETVAELEKLQEEGKFRYLGVSNFDKQLLEEITDLTNIVSLQPHYSLLQREIETEELPYCVEHNIGNLSYGSIGGGILTGKYDQPPEFDDDDKRSQFYPFYDEETWSQTLDLIDVMEEIAAEHNAPIVQVAINWVRQQEGITTALVGAKTPQQAKQNAGAADWDLSAAEIERLTKASNKVIK